MLPLSQTSNSFSFYNVPFLAPKIFLCLPIYIGAFGYIISIVVPLHSLSLSPLGFYSFVGTNEPRALELTFLSY